jgi:hypothetical protein
MRGALVLALLAGGCGGAIDTAQGRDLPEAAAAEAPPDASLEGAAVAVPTCAPRPEDGAIPWGCEATSDPVGEGCLRVCNDAWATQALGFAPAWFCCSDE